MSATSSETSLVFGSDEAAIVLFEGTELTIKLEAQIPIPNLPFPFPPVIPKTISKDITIKDEKSGIVEISDLLKSNYQNVRFSSKVFESVDLQGKFRGDFIPPPIKIPSFTVNKLPGKEVGSRQAFDFLNSIGLNNIDHLGVIGKSGGGLSAVNLGNKLGDFPIDLLVQIDSVDSLDYFDSTEVLPLLKTGLSKLSSGFFSGASQGDINRFNANFQPTDRQLPDNVARGINLYQIASSTDPYRNLINGDFQGSPIVSGSENINVETLFSDSSITHGNIDNKSSVQSLILSYIDQSVLQKLDFDPNNVLSFNGSVSDNRGNLELTPNSKNSVGGAFISTAFPIREDSSFSTEFTFFLENKSTPSQGADGISFVIQNDPRGTYALGGAGGSLGYYGFSDLGIDNSLAISFDTFQNPQDLSDNFISIGTDGKKRIFSVPVSIDLNSGDLINAWVDYDGKNDSLEVFLAKDSKKPRSPILKTAIDLPSLTGSQAFFGFTGATGGGAQVQSIYKWSLTPPTSPKGHIYFLTNPALGKNWTDAEAQAIAAGGHLVTINDAPENQWLTNTFGTSEAFWIGLTDANTEGDFKWISGEPVTYTNWATGEPNDASSRGEDYAEINPGFAPTQWNDRDVFPDGSNAGRGIVEVVSTVTGTAGDDVLYARGGDVTIAGGLGNDIIQGDAGNDVLRGDHNVSWDGGRTGGDDIIYGGRGNDRIGGKGGNDQLYGQEGNDQMWGDQGDDLLRGGTGNDTLVGGKGNDTFVVAISEGTDIISDFEIGKDRLGLANGLAFSHLTTSQQGRNTLLTVDNEVLAILTNVTANLLTQSSFVIIA